MNKKTMLHQWTMGLLTILIFLTLAMTGWFLRNQKSKVHQTSSLWLPFQPNQHQTKGEVVLASLSPVVPRTTHPHQHSIRSNPSSKTPTLSQDTTSIAITKSPKVNSSENHRGHKNPDFVPTQNLPVEQTYAVFIGVGTYHDKHFPTLKYAGNDACMVYQAWLRCGNLDPSRAVLLSTGGPQCKKLKLTHPSIKNIRYSLGDWLLKKALPTDRIVIFYSGHGINEYINGRTDFYLTAHDTNKQQLFSTALSHRSLRRIWKRLRSTQQLILMDACHSGWPMPKMMIPSDPIQELNSSGRVIIASARGNERSIENPLRQMGLFSSTLFDALHGKADLDKDRCVDQMELARYLLKQVPHTAQSRFAHTQNPVQWGVWSGLFNVSCRSKQCNP